MEAETKRLEEERKKDKEQSIQNRMMVRLRSRMCFSARARKFIFCVCQQNSKCGCKKHILIIFDSVTKIFLMQTSLLMPISTQENKHRIGLDFFPSCIIRTAGPKQVENTSTLYHQGCES